MGSLLTRCPQTNAVIELGASECEALVRSRDDTIVASCPHCGQTHDVRVRDTFFEDQTLRETQLSYRVRRNGTVWVWELLEAGKTIAIGRASTSAQARAEALLATNGMSDDVIAE